MPMLSLRSLLILVGVFCSFVVSSALGQVHVASGLDLESTHAWASYTNADDEVILVHLPPRNAVSVSGVTIEGAGPGQLQAVRRLSKLPDAIAAIENRVYLVFPLAYSNGELIRRVYSGRAVPTPVGASWAFEPIDRLDAHPSITTLGDLRAMVATTDTLYALIHQVEKGTKRDQFSLHQMGSNEWTPIELPTQDQSGAWRIAAAGSELIAINQTNDAQLVSWVWDQVNQTWTRWMDEQIWAPAGKYQFVSGMRNLQVVEWGENGLATLHVWSKGGMYTIAPAIEIPDDAQLASLDSVNRILAMSKHTIEPSSQEADAADQTPKRTVKVIEIDSSDGSVIYAGEPVLQVPVSAAEIRFLIGMMILIMVGVLVVVIMPDKSDAMQIPDGFALADPGKRLLATIIDVFLVCVLIGQLFGVRVVEILTLSVIVRSDGAWLSIPTTMISGVVIMSVFEWGLGASPGKFLMGIRVAKSHSGPMERIPLWAALVRNVIKWILPPVAALALVDPEMLHRGDRATRTLVVVPVRSVDPADNDEESGSRG